MVQQQEYEYFDFLKSIILWLLELITIGIRLTFMIQQD